MVYWQPPKQALKKAAELVWEPSVSRYGADEGIPELREALIRKVYKFLSLFFYSLYRGKNMHLDACALIKVDESFQGFGSWYLT